MKTRNLSIVFALALIFGATSCETFYEEKIPSPNDPTQVSPDLLLTNIQVATFANYGGQLARQAGIMTQHIAGTSAGSQTVQVANYNITELTNGNEWDVIYAGAVVNCKIIIDEHGEDNPYYRGMARILKVMNAAIATDIWGDVPYSDAGSGLNGNLSPAYDKQSDLYDDGNAGSFFAELDGAIADLNAPASSNVRLPAGDDLIYGGDVAAWIRLANMLKARLYNHMSEVDGPGSAAKALTAIASAFTAETETAYMMFGTNGNEQNQWYAYNQQRGDYIKMGEFLVDLLNTNTDPRLPLYAALAPNGSYVGTPKDDVDSIATSNIGTYLNSLGAMIPLASYTEMKFIEAEAQLRAGDAPAAATAHNEAVIASATAVLGTAPDATFIAAHASETAGTINLETIMTQKYIAMFGQIESYTDFRRTGFPSGVTPNMNGNITTIPVRFILPQNERLYNTNSVATQPLTAPVWWDQ